MTDSEKSFEQLRAETAALAERVERLEAKRANGQQQIPTVSSTLAVCPPPGEIFVSIASYADPELPRTLDDCLHNAARPDLLRFGICWQYDEEQPVDIERFKQDKRFRIMEYPVRESQGGTWARSVAQKGWDGEPYTLQVDSHMKFEPGWDQKLRRMLRRLPAEKPLITVNSPLFWYDAKGQLHRETDRGVPTAKLADWKSELGWAPWISWGETNHQIPGRTRFICGNFVFTLGQWNVEVPQDPEHYYWGEEFNLTVRSYTHGYDLFLPEEIVAWHMCHFGGPPRRHWEHGNEVVRKKNQIAFERLRLLLYSDDDGGREKLGRFNLGQKRTKHDYEIYAGFDFTNKRAHPDVYTGANPDPVTIKCKEDWAKCITFQEYKSIIGLDA